MEIKCRIHTGVRRVLLAPVQVILLTEVPNCVYSISLLAHMNSQLLALLLNAPPVTVAVRFKA
jgi:hypothetical protein